MPGDLDNVAPHRDTSKWRELQLQVLLEEKKIADSAASTLVGTQIGLGTLLLGASIGAVGWAAGGGKDAPPADMRAAAMLAIVALLGVANLGAIVNYTSAAYYACLKRNELAGAINFLTAAPDPRPDVPHAELPLADPLKFSPGSFTTNVRNVTGWVGTALGVAMFALDVVLLAGAAVQIRGATWGWGLWIAWVFTLFFVLVNFAATLFACDVLDAYDTAGSTSEAAKGEPRRLMSLWGLVRLGGPSRDTANQPDVRRCPFCGSEATIIGDPRGRNSAEFECKSGTCGRRFEVRPLARSKADQAVRQ